MVIHHKVEGYDEFKSFIKDLEAKVEVTYVLFCGSLDKNGQSWCPDCVKAEPVIEEIVKEIPGTIHLVHVGVGDRAAWKDPKCPFRTDPELKITSVPTILRWTGPQRLEGDDFNNRELIEMVFEDD